MQQVREALGVTLSVLCSNIRLYHSSHRDNVGDEKTNDVDDLMKDESWVQYLTERAAEAVVNIQIASQSDKAVNPIETSSQNGHLDGDSQDDMKWMETVLTGDIVLWVLLLFIISFNFYFTNCLLFLTNTATLLHHLVIEVWEIILSA
jgi:hypothetical protein